MTPFEKWRAEARRVLDLLERGQAGELSGIQHLLKMIIGLGEAGAAVEKQIHGNRESLDSRVGQLETWMTLVRMGLIDWVPVRHFGETIKPGEHVLLSDGYNMEVGMQRVGPSLDNEPLYVDTFGFPLRFAPTHFKCQALPVVGP